MVCAKWNTSATNQSNLDIIWNICSIPKGQCLENQLARSHWRMRSFAMWLILFAKDHTLHKKCQFPHAFVGVSWSRNGKYSYYMLRYHQSVLMEAVLLNIAHDENIIDGGGRHSFNFISANFVRLMMLLMIPTYFEIVACKIDRKAMRCLALNILRFNGPR